MIDEPWPRDALLDLFGALKERFGPYKSWEHPASPGYGRDGDYEAFIDAFAVKLRTSFDDVKKQIDIAIDQYTDRG